MLISLCIQDITGTVKWAQPCSHQGNRFWLFDRVAGLNTGSMLFRNSAWTRKLINEMCAHAHREDLEAMRAVS